LDEREGKMAKLGFFCFVRVKRVLREKVVIVENVMHFGEWERRREGKGAFFFSFCLLKIY